jgi:hypothetical protein
MYRLDGQRKCWFLAAEGSVVAQKPARHYVARRRVATPEESESAPRKREAVDDARAELVNAAPALRAEPAPAQMLQPAPSAQKITTVHTVRVVDAAAQVPPALIPATLDVDQQPRRPQVDVEKLLAEAGAASDEVASAPPPTGANTGGGEEASWLGMVLMALGCAALLSASRTLRQALFSVRFSNSPTELPAIAQRGRNEPSFHRGAAPSGHAARSRGTVADALAAQEAFWEEGIGAPEVFSGRRQWLIAGRSGEVTRLAHNLRGVSSDMPRKQA